MAIICREYKLLFIMTPRTACTAIGDLLCTYYGGEFLPVSDILDSDGRIVLQKKHSTLAGLIKHQLLTMEEARSLLKVATVRNPFDTLVSLYHKQRYKYQPLLADHDSWVNRTPGYVRSMKFAQSHSFNEWLFRKCSRQLVKGLFGHPRSMFVDYTQGTDMVMRFESIQKDLDVVLMRAGVSLKRSIPVINATIERKGRDYRAYYRRATSLMTSFAYAQDLKEYGYAF